MATICLHPCEPRNEQKLGYLKGRHRGLLYAQRLWNDSLGISTLGRGSYQALLRHLFYSKFRIGWTCTFPQGKSIALAVRNSILLGEPALGNVCQLGNISRWDGIVVQIVSFSNLTIYKTCK